MKKKIFLTTATAFLLTLSFNSFAQPAPGRNPGPPPPPREQTLQTITSTSGTVADWLANDDFVYNGFYLQAGSEKLLVKFPPHMGAELTAALKKGNAITVNGVVNTNPKGDKEIRMVSMTGSGKTFTDTPPVMPSTPPAEELVTASGKINELQKNDRGDVSGFILNNKTILRVPPHIAQQLGQLASTGTTVSYTGVKKPDNANEARSASYTIVHCRTITINGTQYLTR